MTAEDATATARETARNLAFINYALLFSAFFFAGAPALVAAIIAYIQRPNAPEPARSHFVFQVRTFWIAFALALLAGIAGLGAVIHVMASLYGLASASGWAGFDQFEVVIGQVAIDATLLSLIAAAVILVFLSGFWLIVASLYGAVRLASNQGIGKSPSP